MHQRILIIFFTLLIACLGNEYARAREGTRSSGSLRDAETGFSVQVDENMRTGEEPSTIVSRCYFDHIAEAYELDLRLGKSIKRCSSIKTPRSAVATASGINRVFSSMVVVPPGTLQIIRI